MKTILHFLLFTLFATSILGQDPDKIIPDLTEADPNPPCFEVSLDYSYNGVEGANYINAQCPDLSTLKIKIKINCKPTLINQYWLIMSVGGHLSQAIYLPQEDCFEIPNPLQYVLPLLGECPNQEPIIDFDFFFYKSWFGGFPQESTYSTNGSSYINVICNGDPYYYSEFKEHDVSPLYCLSEGPEIKNFCCCFTGDESPLCGSDSRLYRFDFSLSESSSTSNSTTTTGSLSIGSNITQYGLSGGVSGNYSYSHQYSTVNSSNTTDLIRIDHRLSNSLPGKCFNIGYYLDEDIYNEYKVITDCQNGDSEPEWIGEYSVLSGTIEEALHIVPCNIRETSENDCPVIEIKISSDKHDLVDDCRYDIFLEIEGADENNLEIYWTMNGQYTFGAMDLIGFPNGVYEVEVIDECCNSYNETITLCDELIPLTDFEYDRNENKWCRDIDCVCGDGTKSLKAIQKECITPDQIETVYNNKECVESHYYNGELLGQFPGVEADFNKSYDFEDDECQYQYYCQSGTIEEIIL